MFVKHVFVYLWARGIPALIALGSLSLYTHLLTPENYGVLSITITSLGLINILLFQWMRMGIQRYLQSDKFSRGVFLSTIGINFLSICIFTIIFGLLVSILFRDISPILILVSVILLIVQSLSDITLEILRSDLRPINYGLAAVLRSIFSIIFAYILLANGFGVLGVLIGLLLGTLIAILVNIKVWNGLSIINVDKSLSLILLKYGFPLTITFLFNFIVSSSDRYLLAWLDSSRSVGLYAASYDVAQNSLIALMMVVNLAAVPQIMRSVEKEGLLKATHLLSNNAFALLIIALPVTISMSVLSKPISSILFGSSYTEVAAKIIPWVAYGALIAGMKAFYVDVGFQLLERTTSQLKIVIICAVINVFLNLYAIPEFGVMGAAYTTVLTYIIGFILSFYYVSKYIKLDFPYKKMWPVLISCIILFLFYRSPILSNQNIENLIALLITVFLGTCIYIISILSFSTDVRRILFASFGRMKSHDR